MKNINYEWDADSRTATCTLICNSRTFTGKAHCHPDDEDMMSQYTGYAIATFRAELKSFKFQRTQTEHALKAYQHLYSILCSSKQTNHSSYEMKMLRKKIDQCERSVKFIQTLIQCHQEELEKYIEGKEEFYKNIRQKRESKS